MVSPKSEERKKALLLIPCNTAADFCHKKPLSFRIVFILLLLILCGYFIFHSPSQVVDETSAQKRAEDQQRFEPKQDSNKLEPALIGNRTVIRSEIAIYVIVNKTADWKMYELAQASVACYCKMFNYSLIQISMDALPAEINKVCKVHKDIYFERHCVTAQIFRRHPEIKWFFFQGADAGIINPLHFLEDYIDDKFDMTWLQAGFNYDIFTDAYLARNNNFSYDFLMSWAEFEWKAPKRFYSNDNGPIHQVLVDKFAPNHPKNAFCRDMWEKARDYWEEQKWVACARSIFNGSTEIGPIKIIHRGAHNEWLRNQWHSFGVYSLKDFMLHGWKRHYFKAFTLHVGIPIPLLDGWEFPLDKCTYSKEGLDLWKLKYKPELLVSNARVREIIEPKFADVFQRHTELMRVIKFPKE